MRLEDCKFQQNPDVLFTCVESDEAALMHLGTKLPYVLNKTGICIWHSLEHGCSVDEIVQRLVKEFDAREEQATRDVLAFLEDLVSFDLVVMIGREGQTQERMSRG